MGVRRLRLRPLRLSMRAVALVLLLAPLALAQDPEPVERPPTRLLRLLRAGDVATLESELAALKGRAEGGLDDRLELGVTILVANQAIEGDVDRWCAGSSSWLAPYVRGRLLAGIAATSSRATISGARRDLERAHALEPSVPHAAAALVLAAPDRSEDWFEKAVAADPGFFVAYANRLTALAPRSGGSAERLLAFARRPLDKVPEEPGLALLLVLAHLELGQNDPAHDDAPDVKGEIGGAIQKLAYNYPRWQRFWTACVRLARGDPVRTVGFLEKAAACGSTSAMVRLSEIFSGSPRVARDEAKVRSWLERAALAGDPRGQALWGELRARGEAGVSRDEKEALRWWRLAAEAEDPHGLFCLGRALVSGVGTAVDLERGLSLAASAAERGSADAAWFLYRHYHDDLAQASKWLARAADLGHPLARRETGR